jgi:hypothetical protein
MFILNIFINNSFLYHINQAGITRVIFGQSRVSLAMALMSEYMCMCVKAQYPSRLHTRVRHNLLECSTLTVQGKNLYI